MKYKSDEIYWLLFDHIGLERGDELTTKMVEEHLSEFTKASDDLKRIEVDLAALEAENERLREFSESVAHLVSFQGEWGNLDAVLDRVHVAQKDSVKLGFVESGLANLEAKVERLREALGKIKNGHEPAMENTGYTTRISTFSQAQRIAHKALVETEVSNGS